VQRHPVICLVPEFWLRARPSDTPSDKNMRKLLQGLMARSIATTTPEEGCRGLPPIVSYCLLEVEVPAVLVSNDVRRLMAPRTRSPHY